MARYYFHTEDGSSFHDNEGTELGNVDDAKSAAVRMLAELLLNDVKAPWKDGGLTVTVTDAAGLILLRLDVAASKSSAVS